MTKQVSLKNEQDFGQDPTKVRESNHYRWEYVQTFVQKWDELIDWDARAQSEGDFFIRLLKKHKAHRVLDVATGTGFHSVRVLQAGGMDVTSADGSPEMLTRAFENARRQGYIMKTVLADWRWLSRDVHGKFDAVICLGNSFTHLFNEDDRRKALAEFYSVLRHDGILIIDQRNYDSILDKGFDSKHTYYYCGDNVEAVPEHVDDGLARFRYSFPDGSKFYLNMCPIRRDYLKNLMLGAGFQHVECYGDFQETYHEEDPDFFVHVAHKTLDTVRNVDDSDDGDNLEQIAQNYYDSDDADRFYATIWGGEDIHIGMYDDEHKDISAASRQTVQTIADQIQDIDENTRVLDIGAGYGGTARYLSKRFGCMVSCLNISPVQNERNRKLNEEQGLSLSINVVDGSFEDIPAPNESFDVVWSQDSILHSNHRAKVFSEVNRVLAPGGQFIFTDPMAGSDVKTADIKPILYRIHLDSMGSLEYYNDLAEHFNWEHVQWIDFTHQLVNHYSAVLEETKNRASELSKVVSNDYIERMKAGLQHWIEGGKEGRLQWGVLQYRKPKN